MPSHQSCSIIVQNVLKHFAIFTGKSPQKIFLSCNFIKKETLAQGFSCDFNFFTKHLWMTASNSQRLLALYVAIIYSWQLSSSEKSLVRKKTIQISQGFDRFRFLLHRFFFQFSLNNVCFPCQLRKAYAVLLAANRFVGPEK